MNNEKGLQAYNGDSDILTTVMESVPMIADDSIVAIAEQAEKRLTAINKIMSVDLRVTTPLDWCLIGGVPYLQESGSTKVARLFGISTRIKDIRKETRSDGHYLYTYLGEFSMSGSTIEAVGARGSYDDFFTGSEKKDDKGNIIKPKKTAEEIDERDVKLSAYTNFMNNGIKRILPGLRNITTETLKDAGINPDKIRGYGFNSGAPKEESPESADKRLEIQRMLEECCGGEVAKVKAMLKKCTSFTKKDGSTYEGKDDVLKLTEAQIPPTYEKVKKGYDDWKAKHSEPLP